MIWPPFDISSVLLILAVIVGLSIIGALWWFFLEWTGRKR